MQKVATLRCLVIIKNMLKEIKYLKNLKNVQNMCKREQVQRLFLVYSRIYVLVGALFIFWVDFPLTIYR